MNTLNQRIQSFYDRSTQLWLDTWGEHMHHGYYGPEGTEQKDRLQAQIDLVKELLQWGKVRQAGRILDAGCGVGGSARLLAHMYDAEVLGVTLSPVQARQAEEYTISAGLQDRVRFEVRDVLTLTAADGPFDLIWSLESAEHMPRKKELLGRFYDLLSPGGRLVMATWCHRPTPPALTRSEQKMLNKLYTLYHLPPMISLTEYKRLTKETGFHQVEIADWSRSVAPFWQEVIHSAMSWQGIQGLFRAGWPTIRGAWAMRYMTQGYKKGLIKFGLIQGQK